MFKLEGLFRYLIRTCTCKSYCCVLAPEVIDEITSIVRGESSTRSSSNSSIHESKPLKKKKSKPPKPLKIEKPVIFYSPTTTPLFEKPEFIIK